MKIKLLIILILLSLSVKSQEINWKAVGIKSGLMFISGFCDGTSETLRVHYDEFENVFVKANPNYWNPSVSWINKYKNGDPSQGPKFLFSKNALVWTTDGYHMVRMIRNVTMITAIVIPIGKHKNWKQYVVEAGCYYVTYTGGFNLAYDVIYK